MKKFIFAVIAALTIASPALADEVFFPKQTIFRGWSIIGLTRSDFSNDKYCSARLDYSENDGSAAEITKNIDTGELYIWVRNTDWNITGAPVKSEAILTAFKSGKSIKSGTMEIDIKNKNSVIVPRLEGKELTDVLWDGDAIRIVMPNNISNIWIKFGGKVRNRPVGQAILAFFVECLKSGKNFVPASKPKGETL